MKVNTKEVYILAAKALVTSVLKKVEMGRACSKFQNEVIPWRGKLQRVLFPKAMLRTAGCSSYLNNTRLGVSKGELGEMQVCRADFKFFQPP